MIESGTDSNLYDYIQEICINDVKSVISEFIIKEKIFSELVSSIRYSLEQSGKFKRALLCYLVSMCFKKDPIDDRLKFIAASLEIMHSASLIHDDIIDNGLIRRGNESVLKRYGLAKALLTGDYLIFSSIKIASSYGCANQNSLEIINKMTGTYCDLCFGQSLEENLIGNLKCTLEQYFEVIRLKTAVFFEMVCEVSGLCQNASKSKLKSLKGFGRNLGMAYQIRDDILGFLEDKKHQDKSNTSDLERNLVTLPIIIAYKLSSPKDKKIIEEYFGSAEGADYGLLFKIIDKTKAIDISKKYIEDYIDTAKEFLKPIPDTKVKSLLINFAEALKV